MFFGGPARSAVPWRLQAASATAVDAGYPLRVDARSADRWPTKPERAADEFSVEWKTGDEVFAIDPKMVVHIDFETTKQTVVVDRAEGSRNRFEMTVTTRATGKQEHCKANALMRDLLPSLSSIRVQRTFAPTDAEALWARQGPSSALLRIRDRLDAEPKAFQILLTDGSGSSTDASIVFREQSHLFVPSVRADLIKQLRAGCANATSVQRP
jgi:hypothetical protein